MRTATRRCDTPLPIGFGRAGAVDVVRGDLVGHLRASMDATYAMDRAASEAQQLFRGETPHDDIDAEPAAAGRAP
jgi:hypothetical protein